MTNVVTFDGQPPPGTINLAIGQPSADTLPVDLVRRSSELFFGSAHTLEFNYGVVAGDERFLASLAGFLTRHYGSPARPEELFTTAGNSQALDLAAVAFAKPGDTVFVEEPSYFLAFNILRDHGLNVVGIPIDDVGICIESLQQNLRGESPAFRYTIPSFHNPTGQSTSTARRRQVLELAEKFNFLIVADEVYQLLYYDQPPPAAYGTMIHSDRVVSLGSFSKILAPAMRLGWIQTSPRLLENLTASGFVNSGGSINHFTSHVVRNAIDEKLLDAHIERLREVYRGRLQAMDAALRDHFANSAQWKTPQGGYFFWLRCNKTADTALLRDKASERQAGFQSGGVFSSVGGLSDHIRLCFAHYDEADIHRGIERLAPLFD